jgi:hypothetical protein
MSVESPQLTEMPDLTGAYTRLSASTSCCSDAAA